MLILGPPDKARRYINVVRSTVREPPCYKLARRRGRPTINKLAPTEIGLAFQVPLSPVVKTTSNAKVRNWIFRDGLVRRQIGVLW